MDLQFLLKSSLITRGCILSGPGDLFVLSLLIFFRITSFVISIERCSVTGGLSSTFRSHVHVFGVKIIIFSKMDIIFKFYTQKLFWEQNFQQNVSNIKNLPSLSLFPFLGVKIIIFSKIDLILKF